jgi:hypothetical protein
VRFAVKWIKMGRNILLVFTRHEIIPVTCRSVHMEMSNVDDHCKHITACVDDLAIASANPKKIIKALSDDYEF